MKQKKQSGLALLFLFSIKFFTADYFFTIFFTTLVPLSKFNFTK